MPPPTPSPLAELLKFIITTFTTKDVIFVVRDAFQNQWARFFAARNVLILGAKQTGKTSLQCFLKNGYPYDIVNGTIVSPSPTAGIAIVDERVTLDRGSWAKLTRDVAGDINARELWERMITDVRPQGIIYMIDGRRSDTNLLYDVEEMRRDVLAHYAGGLGALSALHVFLNYADHWGTTPTEVHRKRRVVEHAIDTVVSDLPALTNLKIEVIEAQLSINGKPWDITIRALKKFGADMAA